MRIPRKFVGVMGAGALLLLSGCGDDGGDGGSEGTGSAESSGADDGGSGAEATPLTLDATAGQSTWTVDDQAHAVDITPVSLARGDASDLENIRLDDEMEGFVPYYLTVEYTASDTALSDGDLDGFSVVDAGGWTGERITIMGGFSSSGESPLPAACDAEAPDRLAAGQSAEVCQIHMLPPSMQPAAVSYVDDGAAPLVWSVEGGEGGENATLPAGETAATTWLDSDEQEIPLNVTPAGVAQGAPEDLADWDVDTEGRVPYFVSVEYQNDHPDIELYPSMQDSVTMRTASGQEARKVTLIDVYGREVEQCRDRVPDEMVAPGGTVTQCSIFLVQEGDTPASMTFAPNGGEPLYWYTPEAG
ncbi:hypothetical protein [Streptomyces marincola]|nr:hypothetical protein [Streptomyces marincola]